MKLIQNMLAAGSPWRRCAMRRACCATPGPPTASRWCRAGRSRAFPTPRRPQGLSQIVPFLVEDELVRLGAQYSRAEDWQPHVIADGLLITGQNPASSVGVAEALLERLRQ